LPKPGIKHGISCTQVGCLTSVPLSQLEITIVVKLFYRFNSDKTKPILLATHLLQFSFIATFQQAWTWTTFAVGQMSGSMFMA